MSEARPSFRHARCTRRGTRRGGARRSSPSHVKGGRRSRATGRCLRVSVVCWSMGAVRTCAAMRSRPLGRASCVEEDRGGSASSSSSGAVPISFYGRYNVSCVCGKGIFVLGWMGPRLDRGCGRGGGGGGYSQSTLLKRAALRAEPLDPRRVAAALVCLDLKMITLGST
jgi:hypothetical protein